ncbi:P-loop containing nucleoside triphosphate hydrolase protein [Gorgonomyces haynaldii]|nr:P-loop containing nucleoside triphosphate hydrolase protein [Gorgonomyces haynaldii]
MHQLSLRKKLHLQTALEQLPIVGGQQSNTVQWHQVRGYKDTIQKLQRIVYAPQEHPETFQRLGIKPSSGILLYGPSGCGKTLLANALSSTFVNMVTISPSELFSKYLGDSEAAVRNLFQRARKSKPCIVFLDDLDCICTKRQLESDESSVNERVLSTLLNEMDGISENDGVIYVCCTNRPWELDDALIRPGRLDHLVYLPLPDESSRLDIIQYYCQEFGANLSQEEMQELAHSTLELSGADIKRLFRYLH